MQNNGHQETRSMQRYRAYGIATVLLGILFANASARGALGNDIGTTQWFDKMRAADNNHAMLKALAGSNGQAVVPADCTEVSAILNIQPPKTPKGKPAHLRIVATDDREDNVPRSPYIYQENTGPSNFYVVLRRGLTYDFFWLLETDEQRFASWGVPANAPKQLRVSLSFDAKGSAKIMMAGAEQAPISKAGK
jgi:hypothetical protein